MEALLVSAGIVALAEFGDKTQLLAIMLAARYRTPPPIVLGILVATLANHALAALAGAWVNGLVGAEAMRWILAASFFAMAAWILVPDKPEDGAPSARRLGPFAATAVAFFLVEMGDKTQVATIALAARFHTVVPVMAGTTLGMLIADVPAVLFGDRICGRAGIRIVRWVAAGIFAALGLAAAAGVDLGLR